MKPFPSIRVAISIALSAILLWPVALVYLSIEYAEKEQWKKKPSGYQGAAPAMACVMWCVICAGVMTCLYGWALARAVIYFFL